MFLLASHAYKHSFVGSTHPDGDYDLVPSAASGVPEEQPPQQVGVPADQDLGSTPVTEPIIGKHQSISQYFQVLALMLKYLCIRFIGVD
jgi:hypothetical protein